MSEDEMEAFLAQLKQQMQAQLVMKQNDLGLQQEMKWPRLLPMMHMHAESYTVEQYGSIFCLYTTAMSGMMKLVTIVCTPYQGSSVPVLLIDAMRMMKKQAVFVEYYDCTEKGADASLLKEVFDQYSDMPDYDEKPAWYVKERMKESLIKGGSDWNRLQQMALASSAAYAKMIKAAPLNSNAAANQNGLNKFIDRMVNEGNPSAGTMEKVMGREKAEQFFRTVIMPEQK